MSDLIARDAAIAAIEAAKQDFPDTEFVVDNSARLGLSRAALEVQAAPSLWVSVKDAMPLQARSVLVRYSINGTTLMDIAAVWACRQTKGAVFRTNVGTLIRNVTHWMPLPAPPVD